MFNFVTNREYTGKNVDILMASGKGEEFAGFHQGKKFFGVKGTDLKGMKAAASVQFIVQTTKANGDESKSIRYKSVFAKSDFENAIAQNRVLNPDRKVETISEQGLTSTLFGVILYLYLMRKVFMKDSDRYGDYRTGQNVVFKYVPDYSSPLMLEGVIKNIVTNGSGKRLEYLEVEAIKSKLMHFIRSDEIYATVERGQKSYWSSSELGVFGTHCIDFSYLWVGVKTDNSLVIYKCNKDTENYFDQ